MCNSSKELQRKSHPREDANIFSHFFFIWQLPVFFKGYRNQFKENTFYSPLAEHESKLLGDKLERLWQKEVAAFGSNASLWKVLAKIFGKQFVFYGLGILSDLITRLLMPFFLWKLLSLYAAGAVGTTENKVYFYIFLLVLLVFLRVASCHYAWFAMEHLGVKIQVACSSLIYRKSLNLSQEILMEVSVGRIVNLLATDAGKFSSGFMRNVHYLWLAPITMVATFYILYLMLGATSLIGMSVFLIFIPYQIYASKKTTSHQLKAAYRTDQRIRLINEIVGGMKVIKVLAWEQLFTKLVETCRKQEMHHIKAILSAAGIVTASTFFLNRISIFFSVLPVILMGQSLNSQYIFVIAAFCENMRVLVIVNFSRASLFFGDLLVSVKRIEHFLKTAEIKKNYKTKQPVDITVTNVSLKNDILKEVSLKIHPDQLVAIVGPVGCGKSTLLQVILEETSLLQGTLQVGGTISYVSQDPWVFGGTVKDNILFGEDFDEVKYNRVLKVCSLEHDLKMLLHGDLTFVEDKGAALSGGQRSRINLARGVYRDADIYLLDDPLSAVDVHVGEVVFKSCLQEYLRNKLRILVTHQLQYLDRVDFIYLMENGRIVDSGTYEELKSKDYFKSLQAETNVKITEEMEEDISQGKINNLVNHTKENLNSGSVSRKVYTSYLKAGAGLFLTMALIFLHVLSYLSGGAHDYILTLWVNLEQVKSPVPTYFFYIYVSSTILVMFLCLILEYSFVKFSTKVSKNLHNRMLNHVIYSPMKFFSDNTSGQILNRFSSDIWQIDRHVPINVTDVSFITMHSAIVLSLIAVVNYWTLVPSLIVLTIFFSARNVYLRTACFFKRLEANSRSPVFSQVTNTLQGLVTIRAFDAAEKQKNLFDTRQNIQTSSRYMSLACEFAFGFWLDFCCFIFFVVITLSVTIFRHETYDGNIGLSITSCLLLIGMMQFGTKQFAELENQMVSVERVLEYVEIDTESKDETNLATNWPTTGKIEFQEVSLRYNPSHPLVLEQVTFVINPKEKIGIVGRTGAGKSSLISVIFRLFEFEGNILIDGINSKSLPLHVLRSKITIIPQEPVLFSSSIRTNLDPFEEYDDTVLWNALEEVELKDTISAIPAGLSSKLSEGGLSFSVGQKQMLCLARAIVRKNVILIMDEATANVDLKTDELIRKTIRRTFGECTVLTIAHRLDTVIECDRILVMGDGCCLEFDSPDKLLQNTNGAFYKLLHCGQSSKAAT